MRSVLNHNLSTISFMQNNLLLFETLYCCLSFLLLKTVLLFVFFLCGLAFGIPLDCCSIRVTVFSVLLCFCTCQIYKLYLSDMRSLASRTHPFKPSCIFCIWWKLSFPLLWLPSGQTLSDVVLTHFSILSTQHRHTIRYKNRVNNKWQQQLEGENYLEHVKIFQFRKNFLSSLAVAGCLFCLTIKN